MFSFLFAAVVCTHAENKPHYKPGANVVFRHNFQGQTNPGDTENFELYFKLANNYRGQILRLTFNPGSALILTHPSQLEWAITSNEIRVPLQLNSQKEGKHFLGIQVEIIDENGNSAYRVFEMAIRSGNVLEKSQKPVNTVHHENGRRLQILKSEERLK